jgi:hypothetical protein
MYLQVKFGASNTKISIRRGKESSGVIVPLYAGLVLNQLADRIEVYGQSLFCLVLTRRAIRTMAPGLFCLILAAYIARQELWVT